MTNFVLLYSGGSMPEGEAEQQEMMAAWGAWYGTMGEAIVDGGNPFGAAKKVTADGVSNGADAGQGISGYTIIAAESLDEAVAKVTNHPHLQYEGEVSVYETFEM